MNMEKKRGRGRPSVTEMIAGESAETYEKLLKNGKKFRSKRSIADLAYTLTAGIILSEADPKLEDLELICSDEYQCRSILNQLGRMHKTEGYSEKDVILIAEEAIKNKKAGRSVKDIEQYIKHGRMTGEW